MDETKTQELIYFNQLKQKLKITVESKLEIRKDFKEWSGSDIQTFQIDLEQTCKSTVSEKWVYLHFKKDSEKIPRVDVLNLLCKYCGYKNWDDFKHQSKPVASTDNVVISNKKVLGVLAFVVLLLIAVWAFWPSKQCVVVFRDAYTHEVINPDKLNIVPGKNKVAVLAMGLKMKKLESDSIMVDGAYYKPKKFLVDAENIEDTVAVELFPDDYALMLNFFSRSQLDDWEKRRLQLDDAIHEDAKIFQSHPQHEGIEMLNKQEFIDRLILPVNSLKNLEILNIIYKDGQIHRLRFVQKEDEHENI